MQMLTHHYLYKENGILVSFSDYLKDMFMSVPELEETLFFPGTQEFCRDIVVDLLRDLHTEIHMSLTTAKL